MIGKFSQEYTMLTLLFTDLSTPGARSELLEVRELSLYHPLYLAQCLVHWRHAEHVMNLMNK